MNFLMFDIGASNGRASIGKFDGEKIRIDVVHRFENRPVFVNDILYWDILRLFSEIKIGICKSVQKNSKILSIGIDMWGNDFGIIDKEGNLISNPVHYRSKISNPNFKEIFEIMSEDDLFSISGYNIKITCDLFQLFFMSRKNDPAIKCGKKYLALPDLFNYFLTGILCSEVTRAATTIMLDQNEKKWSEIIIENFNIPRKFFCKIIFPGEKIAYLNSQTCNELDIKPLQVIAVASHDTASAVASIPAIDKKCNWAFVSMGTWCILGKETMRPLINNKIKNSGFANEVGVDGTNILFKNSNGFWVIQQCRRKWIYERNEELSWDSIIDLAYKVEPFSFFIDVDSEEFLKVQPNMSNTIIEWCIKTNQNIPQSIGEIARCVYDSLILKIKLNLDLLNELLDEKIDLLYLIGGGTQNKKLCQWIANICNITIKAGLTEAASVGNLLMQLKGLQEIKNLEEGRNIVSNSFNFIEFKPEKGKNFENYKNFLNLEK